jgi:hypothetical protein
MVDRQEIEAALERAEAATAAGGGAAGTGFWKAVAAVKGDPALVAEHADRIGRIDRRAFENWALIRIPAGFGTALAVLGTIAGLGLVLAAYYVAEPWNGVLLVAGTGVTMVTTHGLTHLAVGGVSGMRFTHWFIAGLRAPHPGVKVDYATYLRVPARRRAWMHVSAALVTKAIPFLALGPALVIPVAGWATAVLLVIGVVQIVTDVLFSTKSSDWMKYRREMSYADRGGRDDVPA